ncbi:MAG: hypothetical protein WB778_00960 [Thermoplasmata archaeon]
MSAVTDDPPRSVPAQWKDRIGVLAQEKVFGPSASPSTSEVRASTKTRALRDKWIEEVRAGLSAGETANVVYARIRDREVPDWTSALLALDEKERAAHFLENPWRLHPGWEYEAPLPILKDKNPKTHFQEPVEPGYECYNELVEVRHARPFRGVTGEARVAIPSGHGVLIEDPRSPDLVDSLGYRFYTLAGDRVPQRELSVAVKALLGRALARDLPPARIVDLRLRVAPAGVCASLLYMADPRRCAIHVGSDGWWIEEIALPVFDHRAHMLPLPEPTPAPHGMNGWRRVLDLARFVRLKPQSGDTAEDQPLLVLSILVLYVLFPDSPKPVVVLVGGENSGKTGAAIRLQALVDPSAAPVLTPSQDQALADLATNHSVINLDNISYIGRQLSDDLARLSTGVGLVKRKLYSDRDEVIALSAARQSQPALRFASPVVRQFPPKTDDFGFDSETNSSTTDNRGSDQTRSSIRLRSHLANKRYRRIPR